MNRWSCGLDGIPSSKTLLLTLDTLGVTLSGEMALHVASAGFSGFMKSQEGNSPAKIYAEIGIIQLLARKARGPDTGRSDKALPRGGLATPDSQTLACRAMAMSHC